MSAIHCCRDCIPPKRQIGCHAYCEAYIREKAVLDEIREKERKWKEANLGPTKNTNKIFTFHLLCVILLLY